MIFVQPNLIHAKVITEFRINKRIFVYNYNEEKANSDEHKDNFYCLGALYNEAIFLEIKFFNFIKLRYSLMKKASGLPQEWFDKYNIIYESSLWYDGTLFGFKRDKSISYFFFFFCFIYGQILIMY